MTSAEPAATAAPARLALRGRIVSDGTELEDGLVAVEDDRIEYAGPASGFDAAAFGGDADGWNPEEMLVAALSQCHLLSYLHVAVTNGVVVTHYVDSPVGTMLQEGVGGHFTKVLLRPVVTIEDPAQVDLAMSIHQEASRACFIASSVNFPVEHEPRITVA